MFEMNSITAELSSDSPAGNCGMSAWLPKEKITKPVLYGQYVFQVVIICLVISRFTKLEFN